MKKAFLIFFLLILCNPLSAELKFKVAVSLDASAADKKGLPSFLAEIKDLGFNGICVARSGESLKLLIDEAKKQNLDVYVVFSNFNPPEKLKQVISKDERKLLSQKSKLVRTGKFIDTFGTEPVETADVLMFSCGCFDKADSVKYYADKAKEMAKIPGIKGIFFDDLGYQNYYACFCEDSLKKQEEYLKAHSNMSKEEALYAFSEESMITFFNTVISAVKEVKPDLVAVSGNYPYFKPDTLFSNKVNADYFTIDVSWGGLPRWDIERVKKYAEYTAKEAKTYQKNQNGVIYLGIYGGKDRKPIDRLNEELNIIKQSNVSGIIIYEVNSILDDEPTAKAVSTLLGGKFDTK